MEAKPKIFLYCIPTGGGNGEVSGSTPGGDVIAYGLAEDGECVSSHYCSSPDFAKYDLGLTSDRKHDLYDAKYPDGYELEWIEFRDLEDHDGFTAALAKNQQQEAA